MKFRPKHYFWPHRYHPELNEQSWKSDHKNIKEYEAYRNEKTKKTYIFRYFPYNEYEDWAVVKCKQFAKRYDRLFKK